MGAEFVVDTAEEMCDLMCNNNVSRAKKPEESWWYFTFGDGQEHEGMYVKIYGTFITARDKMCERYGTEWAFQYSEKKWKEIEADPERYWEMETELEVIK